MTRSRSAWAAIVATTLLLGACGGDKEANQGDVKDEVVDQMLDPGYVSAPGADPLPLDEADADDVGDCVSETLFDPEVFTPEERDAVATAADGDPPDPDLVVKVEALVNDCFDEVVGSDSGDDADDADADSDEDTTSEG